MRLLLVQTFGVVFLMVHSACGGIGEDARAALPEPEVTPTATNAELDPSRPDRLRLGAGISGITERELLIEFPNEVEWVPDVEEPTPEPRFLRPRTRIEGTWARFAGHDAVILAVSAREDGLFNVDFEAGGDLGGWRLGRVGKYEDGVLTLNLPVKEYLPREYRKLFAAQLLGKEYLVSSPVAPELTRLESEMRSSEWMQEMYLLSRRVAEVGPDNPENP